MYRYGATRWNDLLLTLGVLRVGTLHDFRRLEHAPGVSDHGEGTKTVHTYIDDLHVKDPNDPEAKLIESFGIFKFEGTNIRISNIGLAREFNAPNCYIHCTSKVHSKTAMASFEGADSCICITNPQMFYGLLTDAINAITPVRFAGVRECVYDTRKEEWNRRDWGIHPALLKEKKYEAQSELRAIWEPVDNRALSPIITGNWRLTSCCERADI